MQESLFNKEIDKLSLQSVELNNGFIPNLVSFRELVPEITDTSYLTHSLYYYPAKFIPQVVNYIIKNFTKENDLIVDPFAGSGTVGLEAYLANRNSFLMDLNYLLNHIIPIKIPSEKNLLDIGILYRKLAEVFDSKIEFKTHWKNIDYWYYPEILNKLSLYWGGLKNLDNDIYSMIIQVAMVKASKYYSYAEHRTPKLFKSKQKIQFIDSLLSKNWMNSIIMTIKKISIDTLKSINIFISKTKNINPNVVFKGGVDSAFYSIDDKYRIDSLITSPPYLQAQEYIRTFKLDLYWLGYTEDQVKKISKLEIPYRKTDIIIETTTLDSIKSQLKIDKLTDTLDSYFYFTIKALENTSLNIKKGGLLFIFVGNPKVDGIEVETWKIISEYFINKGFKFRNVFEDRIKTRQLFKARNNKNPDGMKSEYLLVLEK